MTEPVGFTDEPTPYVQPFELYVAAWAGLVLLLYRFDAEVGRWLTALLIGE